MFARLKVLPKNALLGFVFTAALIQSNVLTASNDMRLDMAMEELSVRNAAASYASFADAGFNLEEAEKLLSAEISVFVVPASGGDKSAEPSAKGIKDVTDLLRKSSMTFTGKSLDAKHIVGATQIVTMGWRIEHTCLTMTNVLIVSKSGKVLAQTHEDHWLGDGLGNWKIVKKVIISK